jgi:hypothetical protein
MANEHNKPIEITISFTEQQMELVEKLANEKNISPAKAVTAAIEEFIRKEGRQYVG